jgi:hypothetical protein
MKLEHCKVIVSDHVLNIFIGNKKSSFNIEDLNKINAIETTEGSHTGKILGAMLGTGAQVATGDFFGILPVIGTGIGYEEKTFYEILKSLTLKYDFVYPELKLKSLAKEVKLLIDEKSKFVDWNLRTDTKAAIKVDLILLLAKFDYPPIERDEVFKEILVQAENFKINNAFTI